MHLKFSILNLFLLFMRCRYCVEAGGHSVRCVVTRRDAGGGGGGEVPHQKTEQVTQQGAQQDLELQEPSEAARRHRTPREHH